MRGYIVEHTRHGTGTRDGCFKMVTCFFCGVSGRFKAYRRLHTILRRTKRSPHTTRNVLVCLDCDSFIFGENGDD